jgi:hypothetical protein
MDRWGPMNRRELKNWLGRRDSEPLAMSRRRIAAIPEGGRTSQPKLNGVKRRMAGTQGFEPQ